MAASLIVPKSSSVLWDTMQTTCYLKGAWTGTWEWIPFLYPDKIKHCLAPDVSDAALSYNFGNIRQPQTTAFAPYYPLAAEGNFVAVWGHYGDFYNIPLFFGVVEGDTTDLHGNEDYLSGVEHLQCYGMERVLQHCEIRKSITTAGIIDRILKFNKVTGRGLQRKSNRSENVDPVGNTYVFSTEGYVWTNRDIAEYLLYWFVTADTGFDVQLCGETDALNDQLGEHDFTDMNVFEALNKLISPQRGLAWRCIPDDSGTIWIDVVSVIDESYALGDVIVPANREQDVVWWDGDVFALPEIVFSDHSRYDAISVVGDSIFSTASFSITDGTLEPGWTVEMEAEYCAGSAKEGATAADHDVARTSGKLKDVYQKFQVPSDWNGYVYDGTGTGGPYNAMPGSTDLGVIDTAVAQVVYNGWRRFEPRLPWFEQSDMTDPTRFDFEKILVVALNPDTLSWQAVDKMDAAEMPNASVELSDTDMAFWLNPKINHQYALNYFDDGTYDTEELPKIDYSTLIVTAMFETDMRIQINLTLPGAGLGTHYKLKQIVCPGLTAHFVADGTVVDVQDGVLVRYGDDAFPPESENLERWDGDRLLAIAAFAAAYYGKARYAVNLTIQESSVAHFPGSMISAAASGLYYQPIASIVQSREIDFVSMKTHVKTAIFDLKFDELMETVRVG